MAVQIHNDNNGEPGSVVANMAVPNVVRESTGLITSGGRPIFAYEVNYTGPLLTSGTRYWMSVQKTDTGDPDFLWLGSNVNAGNAMFQVGSGAWNLLNTTGVELAFAVMPEPGVAASALTALLTLVGLHARARRKRM